MSKRFKNKICVYCGGASAETADHIVARKFFLKDRRANLPQAPACSSCNSQKSALETYLMTVLPFGGRHPDALQNLTAFVPSRLNKNFKLHHALKAGQTRVWTQEAGLLIPATAVPIDSQKIDELFRFITIGLLWHHTGQCIDFATTGVWAGFLSRPGRRLFELSLGMNGLSRIKEDLGNRTLVYEGLVSADPGLSVWTFSMYGGMKLNGDPSGEEASLIGGLTQRRPGFDRFMKRVQQPPRQPIPA